MMTKLAMTYKRPILWLFVAGMLILMGAGSTLSFVGRSQPTHTHVVTEPASPDAHHTQPGAR